MLLPPYNQTTHASNGLLQESTCLGIGTIDETLCFEIDLDVYVSHRGLIGLSDFTDGYPSGLLERVVNNQTS